MKKQQTYEELVRYAEGLEKRVQELERELGRHERNSEKLKKSFLSNISHEIRTPMNAILGFSSLLNDAQLPGKKREEYMDHITQSSTRLIRIVEAMIDISLVDNGQLQLRPEVCHINQLLDDVYHYFNIERHRRGMNNIALLLNKGNKDKGFNIFTDQFRLRQVLTNLLNNAFKFTEKGIIEFGYRYDEDKHKIAFYITDSGQGILREQSQAIFEHFEVTEQNPENGIDSEVGLGLTLSKGIIKLLGGNIWVESNVFSGSTFRFSISCGSEKELETSSIHSFTSSKLFIA